MSGSLAHVPGRNAGAPPPTVLPRVLSALLGLLFLAGTVTLTAGPAYADSEGVRHDLGEGFLGGYDTDVDGRQACCLDSGSNPALRQTSGPSTITSLDSLSRHQLAELNFVQDLWVQSGDANITAAVALFTLSVADPGTCNSHGMSGTITAPESGFYTQAGIDRSGTTTVDTAGNVCWFETLYDADGEIIAEGECGTPGETMAIHEQPEELTVKTSAAPTGVVGESAHDLATVTGTVPDGDRLVFEAYRHTSDTVTCTPDELVLTSAVIDLDGPGEYRSDDVTVTQVGVYYCGKTILNAEGLVSHRGARGAPDETTTVTSVPETRETPGKPNTPGALAHTGGGDWWPLGLIGGLMAAATGGVLLFGRRLAITRERNGYVREEDRAFQAFQDESDGAEEK